MKITIYVLNRSLAYGLKEGEASHHITYLS